MCTFVRFLSQSKSWVFVKGVMFRPQSEDCQMDVSQRRRQESVLKGMMECSDAWLRPSYRSTTVANTIKGLSHSLEHSIVHLHNGLYRY